MEPDLRGHPDEMFWEIDPDDEQTDDDYTYAVVRDPEGGLVAHVVIEADGFPLPQRNLRRIRAAPEMESALREFLGFFANESTMGIPLNLRMCLEEFERHAETLLREIEDG